MQEGKIIEVDGQVSGLTPSGDVLVELRDGTCIQAEISAKIKVRFIGVRPGDFVRCEVSPYDPAKARVIEKLTGQ